MYNFSRNAVRVGRALASASRAASTSSTSTSAPAAAVAATNASGTSLPATKQSPNYPQPWSTNQQSRAVAYQDARFEQTNLEFQPQPLSAMELIAQEPVRMVNGRIAVCDGGKGPLGHPKVFINLDKPNPKPCGYCGLRFQQVPHHHH
ncbi:ubiquinone oxidoreductase 20 kd subunit [Pyrrhoderma noxium]|uniref:Ubiquinone oxidoreductase 20 kd subunit n=1 Tax=Pyrrhoderma noxium TaxID=2282107 RepID=A0A286US54_9AGAM|nr:ubiquinone oxidoreductase 20 kd subunit [Pyrrhoderma noxium]